VRRYPGGSAWLLVFAFVGLALWPQAGVSLGDVFADEMEDRAQRTAASVLDIIGRRVVIDAVKVGERGPEIAATYRPKTRTITISPIVSSYSEEEFLALVSHEMVHAMFHQMDWGSTQGSANWRSFLLPGETAAEVLGAHIAGMVRSRHGGDGRYLTDLLIRRHRNLCDTQSPASFYQQFARARDKFGLNAVDDEWEYVVFTHVGSVKTVDDMDRICRENPDPWEAVREIGQKYLFTDRVVEQAAKGSPAGW